LYHYHVHESPRKPKTFNNVEHPIYIKPVFFFPMAQQPLLGQNLLIIEASESHSDTAHSLGFLWTSDQPDAETSTWRHTALTTDRPPPPPPRRDSHPPSQ